MSHGGESQPGDLVVADSLDGEVYAPNLAAAGAQLDKLAATITTAQPVILRELATGD